jgi:prepilin-type processing-associated H-X9-DG protein
MDGISLATVTFPASTIHAAEQADGRTGDHYHPAAWGGVNNFAWDNGRPTEVAWRRHNEGANYAYLDGHARWNRFESTFSLPAVNMHKIDQ